VTPHDRRIAVGIFVVVFVTYAWFFGGAGWNQNVNLDLTRAIVEHGSIRIDMFEVNTGDFSRVDGGIYSNKSPGLSMLAVVPYFVIHAVERAAGVDPDDTFILILNLWLCTVAVCGGSGALLAALIYVYGRRQAQVSPAAALTVSLLIAFGTYMFAWSTVLFAHVPSALFLFLSFYWSERKPLLSGAAAGVSVLLFYFTVALLPLFAVLVLLAGRTWKEKVRRGALWIAGGVPFAILLLTYQYKAFGSPFRTAVEVSLDIFVEEDRWLGVMGTPRIEVIGEILFGRFRGLFFVSPILLLSMAGAWVMWRRRILRRDLVAAGVVFVVLVLLNGGFNGWHGGSGIGPRYILPVVPFLAIPMLFATTILRPVWIVIGTLSLLINFLVTAVNPTPSWKIERPIEEYIVPLFLTGQLPASTPPLPLYDWKIMPGHVSVNRQAPDEYAPYVKHEYGSREAEWASFNVGEVWFEGSRWSLLPVLLWMALCSTLLARSAHRQQERTAALNESPT
jgi:hypothetical protein